MNKALRALVILPCLALLAAAATVESEKFEIPFEFQVQKQVLPAGEYQVRQATGSGIAVLVNTKTNESAQFLRAASTHEDGKTRLEFVKKENRNLLKRIF